MPALTTHIDVRHGQTVCRVVLRRVAAARRYTLRVRAGARDVVLTMPARGSLGAAREFVNRYASWIVERLARMPAPVPFEPGARVPLRGVPHLVECRARLRRCAWAEPGSPPLLLVSGAPADAPGHIVAFLRGEARLDVEAAVARHCAALGRAPAPFVLRDTSSRWGSCSSRGSLNFSWRLVLAPPFVLDYLCAHECAHLSQMNHGPAFWALALRLAPRTEEAERWLSVHGRGLLAYGAGGG